MAKVRSKRCPECNQRFRYPGLQAHPWFPFCSERCKTIDLGRWLSNGYAVVEDLSMGHDLKHGGAAALDEDAPE